MNYRLLTIFSIVLLMFPMCKKDSSVKNAGTIQVVSVRIGTLLLDVNSKVINVPFDKTIQFEFTSSVDTNSIKKVIILKDNNGDPVPYTYSSGFNTASITVTPKSALRYASDYDLTISDGLRGIKGETFPGTLFQFTTIVGTMAIESVSLNGNTMTSTPLQNIDPKKITIKVTFSHQLDPVNYTAAFSFTGPALTYSISPDNKTIEAVTSTKAKGFTKYTFSISSSLVSIDKFTFAGYSSNFYTALDSTYQFPLLTDDDLLTLVQRQTFKYFWDFAHPSCGMALERNSSGDIVTTGGSGFGIMAMVVAMERGFVSRSEGTARLDKILTFLETCDRFHGVWPHWINGRTGKTQPFSAVDNGGDIVETSFMLQGLICMRQYLDPAVASEKILIDRINTLYNAVDFVWYTKNEKTLYWEWSPDFGYNLKIQGYNETLITYILAASSPSHSIAADVYTTGYAGNGSIKNGNSYYGYVLPLGQSYGGPLFFTHYSFLGLDPRKLKDQYADYWEQNVNQSLINWSYCVTNPKKYPGYGASVWGLTASDNSTGYSAHSPTNDQGVITPTAAISSIVYTPVQSMNAIRTYYYYLGDHLWGDRGFTDAFNVSQGWWANSTLAIDEGPIICMIENYRTGLLWRLFMSAPEVQNGLTKLGFTY
jgi:hypothetical protein